MEDHNATAPHVGCNCAACALARARARDAFRAEHNDTAPHECCTCEACQRARRALRATGSAAPRYAGGEVPAVGDIIQGEAGTHLFTDGACWRVTACHDLTIDVEAHPPDSRMGFGVAFAKPALYRLARGAGAVDVYGGIWGFADKRAYPEGDGRYELEPTETAPAFRGRWDAPNGEARLSLAEAAELRSNTTPREWPTNATLREAADRARWRLDDYDVNREPIRGPCPRCGSLTGCMCPRPRTSQSTEQGVIIYETALFAAKWWANYLRFPVVSQGLGAPEVEEALRAVDNLLGVTSKDFNLEAIDKFERALAERFDLLIERGTVDIYRDYATPGVLCEALQEAGLNSCRVYFPHNVGMRINKYFVEVKLSYGASYVVVFNASDA